VKIINNIHGLISYKDCLNGKKIYEVSKNFYDSIKYANNSKKDIVDAGKTYSQSFRDCDTIFFEGGNKHLVKIKSNISGKVSYTDCINRKKIYKISNNLFDSIKYGKLRKYNLKSVPVNTVKKMYFEGSFGGGLGSRNSRSTVSATGLLSIGYQFKENLGLGISSISIMPSDGYYTQYTNSVTIDSRFLSRKSVFTFHFGMVTKRTKLDGSDICKFNPSANKFNPTVGLSYRRTIINNFMLGISGVFSNFPIVCEEVDFQTRSRVFKNYTESHAAYSLQIGFTFPKRLKEVIIK
jgi:hypothetical protein